MRHIVPWLPFRILHLPNITNQPFMRLQMPQYRRQEASMQTHHKSRVQLQHHPRILGPKILNPTLLRPQRSLLPTHWLNFPPDPHPKVQTQRQKHLLQLRWYLCHLLNCLSNCGLDLFGSGTVLCEDCEQVCDLCWGSNVACFGYLYLDISHGVCQKQGYHRVGTLGVLGCCGLDSVAI